jgi:hypothetical protein
LLASKLSRNRGTTDIKSAFETAQNKANKSPIVLLTDGWQVYRRACKLQFGSDTVHVTTTPFVKKGFSTNIVERWHGTLKDRLKPMRGMDKSETHQLVLEGFILNYNYLRPHGSLNGKTPAEVARIDFPYKSWLDIIQSQIPKPLLKPDTALSFRQIPHLLKPYRKRPKPMSKSKRIKFPEINRTVGVGRL